MNSPAAKQQRGKGAALVAAALKKSIAGGTERHDTTATKRTKSLGDVAVTTGQATMVFEAKKTTGRRKAASGGLQISHGKNRAGLSLFDFRNLYESTPESRIDLIRAGVGAVEMKAFASDLGFSQEKFCRMFGIAQATVTRKASKQQSMSIEESEKIVGMAKLVGQVQTMLEQSGDPELTEGFDARKWLAGWIEEPIPALGGKRPADYMDTIEGQEMVSRLLSMMQTGAYA